MKSESTPATYILPLALHKLAKRLASERPHEIITVWGMNLRCYYASPSSSSVSGGYLPDEMIGRLATEFIHLSDIPHLLLTKSDIELTGKSVEMTIDVRTKPAGRLRVRSRTVKVKDPDTGKTFFISRSVPDGQQLPDLPEAGNS